MSTAPKHTSTKRGSLPTLSLLRRRLDKDAANWTGAFELLELVSSKQLWMQDGSTSFSAWLSELASEKHISVSTLWSWLKAGRFYLRYQAYAASRGISTPPLPSCKLSAAALVYIEKCANGNMDDAAKLFDIAHHENVRISDLRKAWDAQKGRGDAVVAVNGHSRVIARPRSLPCSIDEMVFALARIEQWLPFALAPLSSEGISYSECTSTYAANLNLGLPNGPCVSLAIAENFSTRCRRTCSVLGFEIVSDRSVLHTGLTGTVLADYFDYMFLVAEEGVVEQARPLAPQSWGVLSYARTPEQKIKVLKQPAKLHPRYREETLAALLMTC